VVHGRRFVVAGLVECIDMDKDPLRDFELTGVVDEAGHLEAIDPETGAKVYLLPGGDNVSPKPKKTKKTQKFSGGGIIRGTQAQVRGRTFRGVF
jgi:hypothetical protein